ncbi:MAG: hypothetical protein N2B03_04795, partial [Boseongicola sp.]
CRKLSNSPSRLKQVCSDTARGISANPVMHRRDDGYGRVRQSLDPTANHNDLNQPKLTLAQTGPSTNGSAIFFAPSSAR